MSLEKELETYRENLGELEQHEGKFVLIHGDDVVDIFDAYSDALRQGYREFGTDDPFLVKRIQRPETAQSITRMFDPTTAPTG